MQALNDDLTNFFSSTNIPTLFLDTSLKIQRFTPTSEILLGLGQMDIGRPIYALNNSLLNDDLIEESKKVLLTLKASQSDEITANKRWFARGISPYKTEDGRIGGVVITFQDITKLKNLSDASNRRERQQATVAQLGMLALTGIQLNEFMDNLVRQVAHALNVEYCKILKYQPDQHNLLLVSGTGWRKGLVGQATVPDQQDSQAGFTLIQNETVIVNNMREEKRFYGPELLFDHDVVSGMSVVINHSTPPYGVLGIHSRSFHDFNQDDANFLQSVSNLLSIAIKFHEANEALKESENKLRIAKDSSNIGSFEYYLESGLTYWDPMLKKLWGLSENEVVTQDKFWAGIHPEDKDHTHRAIEKSAQHDGNGHYSATYRVINQKTKKTFWIHANGQIVLDRDNTAKMIGMVHDITEAKETELSLKQAVEELKNINARKNEFLATLGHELRNPLAAISGGVDLMITNQKEESDLSEMMNRNVQRMSSMLDDLLDLARIARGSVRLDKQAIDLKALVKRIIYEFEPTCALKNQELLLNLSDDNITIDGDITRLEQILSNLLNNASKFTHENGEIKVDVFRQENQATIIIKDNGIGLEGDPNIIFQPFAQVDPTKGNKGIGIGLSLVKSFIEMHDGTVEASSQGRNMGSTFHLTFPLLTSTKKVEKKENKKVIPDIKNNLSVMIVDDNVDATQLLQIRLKKHHCDTAVAYTAKQGLEMLENVQPEVFILDIGLPDMDGNLLLNEIKKRYKEKAIYIAHTGFGHDDAKKHSSDSGFDYHLTKPLDIKKLLSILSVVK